MILKSMTAYVLDQYEELDKGKINKKDYFENIFNYVKFLSMPLELKYFVPCDEDGNVFETPLIPFENNGAEEFNKSPEEMKDILISFQKAKSEVIFEDFQISYFNYGGSVLDKNSSFELRNKDIQICYYKSQPDYFVWSYKTIEEISKYNLTITEQAKQKYKF